MKCPNCNGTGKIKIYDGIGTPHNAICGWCDGAGEYLQTNEEWLRSCNTEQLAKVIALICGSNILNVWRIVYHCADSDVDAVKMWLKQPHSEVRK